jgi:hypothetical protein
LLLLVTIGLVLVGAVSLILGFVTNALGWIYLSIACSVIAAAVLVLFSRMSRTQPSVAGDAGPAPLPDTGQPTAAMTAVGGPATEAVTVPEAAAAGPALAFPIDDYDSLKVNEIVPRLAGLDLDQLDVVREREEQGKKRATVLSRIDDRMDALEAEHAATPVPPTPAIEEPSAAAVAATSGGAGGAPADDSIDDLIEDYDKLSVAQILPLLSELDEDELEDVAAYEEDHKNRASVLDRIDDLLEGEAAPAPAPAKKARSGERAGASAASAVRDQPPAKKAVAKTAAAVKKAPTKSATQAKKAVAKKTAAPAKKAPTKSATQAKKAVAKKSAAPAKKSATKSATKATPAKKTAKK